MVKTKESIYLGGNPYITSREGNFLSTKKLCAFGKNASKWTDNLLNPLVTNYCTQKIGIVVAETKCPHQHVHKRLSKKVQRSK